MDPIAPSWMPKGGWQEFSSADSLQRPAATAASNPKAQQMVRVQPTRGGKGGKTVTMIRGLELDAAGFKALLKKLKTRIGSGGTAKDGVIELQGDQVELALDLLTKEGYRPKRAGGYARMAPTSVRAHVRQPHLRRSHQPGGAYQHRLAPGFVGSGCTV